MDQTTAIDAIVAAADSGAAREAFRLARGQKGLSREIFTRIQAAFGSDPAEARRLASYWQLMLRYGDEPAFAYRAKGAFDRLSGRWLLSARAFQKAGELAPDGQDKFSFQVGAVDSLARAGRVGEAIALATRLSKGLEELGEEALAARVKLNAGNALLWADRYRDAIRWLSEAGKLLEGAEGVYAKLGLSTAELFGGSPFEAHRLAVLASDEADQLGLGYAAAMGRLNVAQSAMLQGKADDALDVLLETRKQLAGSPSDDARVAEFLGDAYVRLNLWTEASDAYDEALSMRRHLPALNVAASWLGLGQARLAAGQTQLAKEALQKARNGFHRCGNRAWAASADTWIAKCLQEERRTSQAARRCARAMTEARQAKSAWHETEALLTGAELGGKGASSAALQRARRLIEGNGYSSLRWRVLSLQASAAGTLPAHRKAFAAIVENRALTTSTASRAAYLRDKSNTIGAYLGRLLANPTPKRVEEAIEVVTRSRSAALLDEILSSGAIALRPDQLTQIQQLRSELQIQESDGGLPTSERRARLAPGRIASLQRRWIEATRAVLAEAHARPSKGSATILTQAEGSIYALKGDRAIKLDISSADLERDLRWIKFELLAPMADRSIDAACANRLIENLARRLLSGWAGGTFSVSPADGLWQVPWAACAHLLDPASEPILALHPTLTRVAESPVSPGCRAMIWIDPHSNLYHAAQEEASFIQRLPNARVCKTAAAVRDSLFEEVDVLHVICHGRHSASNPMFSSLLFGGEAIYAAEIAGSGLRPKLVTLSACDTGNVSVALRQEPDGLARAFLALGAENVIASLWPLDDEAAALAYTSLFERLAEGSTTVEALNGARKAVKEWNPHPYFWAPLVLFGGYAT